MNKKQTSKFLSLVLRHRPEEIGVELDSAGWVGIEELLIAISQHGKTISREGLEQIVSTCDKQRFAISSDGQRIRANQGHSVRVQLQYSPTKPPDRLLHGTPQQFIESIRTLGLKKMQRHHVHLHTDPTVATAVAKRRGRPKILTVHSDQMHVAGFDFFQSSNGVWLTEHVPTRFIDFPE